MADSITVFRLWSDPGVLPLAKNSVSLDKDDKAADVHTFDCLVLVHSHSFTDLLNAGWQPDSTVHAWKAGGALIRLPACMQVSNFVDAAVEETDFQQLVQLWIFDQTASLYAVCVWLSSFCDPAD